VRDLETICSRYHVVPALWAHAEAMAPMMRPGDREEVWAAGGVGPLEGLEISLAASLYAWTWLIDDVPACMFGVGSPSILSGTGIPWLLSGELVNRHWRPFLSYYRPFLDRMRDDFTLLTNWVDARYGLAIRWLGWMGFEIMPPAPHGPFNILHHRFEMRRERGA